METMKIVDWESLLGGKVGEGKPNRCVVLPANVPMLADSLKRTNQNWFARTSSPTDLVIQLGDSTFHLHKLAMVSRSEYLNRLVFQKKNNRETTGDILKIQIDNLPGGRKTFELVVKFCYGWKFDMTASNIASLYCASNFLEMSEDMEEGNLISKTEAFLSFLILSSWKDTFRILKSCESIPHWAKELQIVKRCSEAIAWNTCVNPNIQECKSTTNNSELDPWWFEDVSLLRIDHFVEVIQSIKKRGIKTQLVGSCIAYWTAKWFSQVTLELENLTPKHMNIQLSRVSTECLIRMLPTEENSVTCNFLLQLLKVGMMLKINPELLCVLERRVILMLEKCSVQDLLVKNHGEKESLYDVAIVVKVLQSYVKGMPSSNHADKKLHIVGRLVDGYLIQVARDQKLTVESFKSVIEALPQNARYCADTLYRAIDMYLKARVYLTEEDREDVCRVVEYHRLSNEARQHVMQNDRLPLKLSERFVLLEQVSMWGRVTSDGSNYRKTNAQTSIRISRDLEKREMNQEIKVIRKDVEMMKSQLLELNTCKIKLQKQLKRCIR